MAKQIMKTKIELDELTMQEIQDYKRNVVTSGVFNSKEKEIWEKYLQELTFYFNYRFPERFYKMHDKWISDFNNPDIDIDMKKDIEFLVRIYDVPDGKNLLYYTTIIVDLSEISSFDYIKSIDIQIPEKYMIEKLREHIDKVLKTL